MKPEIIIALDFPTGKKALSFLDLFGNIQHTFSGCDHVINDNNIFALYGITEEFVSNDRVFAVDNSGVVAAFVEHTHIYAKNIGKVYGS